MISNIESITQFTNIPLGACKERVKYIVRLCLAGTVRALHCNCNWI